MPELRYRDVRINYELSGEGEGVLLIMGYRMPGAAWRFQVPTLSERYRVCTYDNRGVGPSEAPGKAWSMAELAEDAHRMLDTLGWARAHVVGVSMGGMIAQELAITRPERVRSLSLIATHPGGLGRVPASGGLRRFVRASVGRNKDRGRATAELLFPRAFIESTDRSWFEEVLRADFAVRVSPRALRAQLAAVMRHDTRGRLDRISCPTLVVKPAQDLLIRPSMSDRLARGIPGARLEVFEEAGHGLVRQSAARLNPLLMEHFAAAE